MKISRGTMIFLNLFLINLLSTYADKNSNDGFCDAASKNCRRHIPEDYKMIFYDVNPPEGFNLRRDVYMRFAIMMAEAHKRGRMNWHLVLPPWTKMYHWKSAEIQSKPTFWSEFFDVHALKAYPVIEMHEAFAKNDRTPLLMDTLYVLKNFENPFENGVFEEKWQITSGCEYEGNYWGYTNITAKEIVCVKFQGKISKLWELVYMHPTDKHVMFMHGEIPLHDSYGTKAFWDCRKSMKFNIDLVSLAKDFVSKKLDCDTYTCPTYLSIHWRRRDFAYSRPNDVPSIDGTVRQIDETIKKKVQDVKKIFIATDALTTELKDLKRKLKDLGYKVYIYKPSDFEMDVYKDGGIAIIDQVICSYAAYFIGTRESTFTFRIQEEREILGHNSDTTFNTFCPDAGPCRRPSRWHIIH